MEKNLENLNQENPEIFSVEEKEWVKKYAGDNKGQKYQNDDFGFNEAERKEKSEKKKRIIR